MNGAAPRAEHCRLFPSDFYIKDFTGGLDLFGNRLGKQEHIWMKNNIKNIGDLAAVWLFFLIIRRPKGEY